MLKKLIQLVGLSGSAMLLMACAGEMKIRDQYETKYTNSKEAKLVLYPSGVEAPENSLNYAIPKISEQQQIAEYDLDELARPPRLVPKPKQHAKDDKDKEKSEQKK